MEIIFSEYYPSPIDQRRDNLLLSVIEGLEELQKRYNNLTPEALGRNESFITIILQAINIAIRNHQKEKLDSLRNAVLNSVLPSNLNDEEKLIFLNYIDEFTPTHLKMLKFLQEKKLELKEHGQIGVRNQELTEAMADRFPEYNDSVEFLNQRVKELADRGLIAKAFNDEFREVFQSQPTTSGEKFLQFISSPVE